MSVHQSMKVVSSSAYQNVWDDALVLLEWPVLHCGIDIHFQYTKNLLVSCNVLHLNFLSSVVIIKSQVWWLYSHDNWILSQFSSCQPWVSWVQLPVNGFECTNHADICLLFFPQQSLDLHQQEVCSVHLHFHGLLSCGTYWSSHTGSALGPILSVSWLPLLVYLS